MIQLTELYITVKALKRLEQLPKLMHSIINGEVLNKIVIQQLPDQSLEIWDGHHRAIAYTLLGRSFLNEHEYEIRIVPFSYRCRFGKISDLHIKRY